MTQLFSRPTGDSSGAVTFAHLQSRDDDLWIVFYGGWVTDTISIGADAALGLGDYAYVVVEPGEWASELGAYRVLQEDVFVSRDMGQIEVAAGTIVTQAPGEFIATARNSRSESCPGTWLVDFEHHSTASSSEEGVANATTESTEDVNSWGDTNENSIYFPDSRPEEGNESVPSNDTFE